MINPIPLFVNNTITLTDGLKILELLGYDLQDRSYFWERLEDLHLISWGIDGIIKPVNEDDSLPEIVKNELLKFGSVRSFKNRIDTALDKIERDEFLLNEVMDMFDPNRLA